MEAIFYKMMIYAPNYVKRSERQKNNELKKSFSFKDVDRD